MNFDQWRHYGRGLFFELIRRPNLAIAAYRESLRHNPGFAQAARCLGYLHAARHDYAAATGYYEQALRLKPDADTWFNLGFLRDQAGHRDEAIAAFDEAVTLDSKLDRAWYGMGLAHATQGRHERAAECLQRAAELQPMNGHAWYALGMAYHHTRQPDKVKEVALHMLRFDPVLTKRLVHDAERSDLADLVRDVRA
jgi:tetratricopeptide (TPR) repeat protein